MVVFYPQSDYTNDEAMACNKRKRNLETPFAKMALAKNCNFRKPIMIQLIERLV